MATAKPAPRDWPFERKFPLWLKDHKTTLNAFAKRHGIPQRTLHGWVFDGVKVPAEGFQRIARATRLSIEYWLDATIPYPPPMDYLNLAESVLALLRTVPATELSQFHEMLSDPDDRRRTLALRRAAGERG